MYTIIFRNVDKVKVCYVVVFKVENFFSIVKWKTILQNQNIKNLDNTNE